jgi:hypothetical protein
MDTFILICRIYVIFVAASGFLFGQLYFAIFEWPATIAGVFGLLSGGLSGKLAENSRPLSYAVIAFCLASLVGVVFDAYHYYTYLDIPGNYYAWIMIGPYCFCLLVIAWKVSRNKSSTKSIRGVFVSSRQVPGWYKFGILEYIPGIRDLPNKSKTYLIIFAVILIMLFNVYNPGFFSQ